MIDSQPKDFNKIAKDIKYIVEGLHDGCTEDSIVSTVKTMAPLYSLSADDVDKVAALIMEMTRHILSEGVCIHSPHENWYYPRKSQIDLSLSDRHLEYLRKQGLSQDVVNKLDNCTDEIVNYLGDPMKGSFFRRGLVMGDVQSGKTNTYMLICNKAADAGYKVIIILTSNIGSLRKQTQQRADSSLIGKDSDRNRDDRWNLIGVGEINHNPTVQAFTSNSGDFSATVANTNGFQVRDPNMSPCVLVVKKNKDILKNLSNWLRDLNVVGDSKINQSLLVIDDEADYASVNTKKGEEQSVINKHITTILGMFTRASYCGFTATPFANIFINPDDDRDLFPADFIYCLGTADNYIGPDRLFPSDDPEDEEGVDFPHMIQIIEFERAKKKKDRQFEGLNELKLKHRKDDTLKGIPTSLNEAINEFLLTCSIRDLRGMRKAHMSMLINMSRFTDVQENIRTWVDDRFKSILRSVRVYSHDPVKAVSDPYIYDLKRIFDQQYKGCGFTWDEVLESLEAAILPIIVRTINRNNGAESIDYKSYPDGLRIIAIGGDSLSRGLTLEGLTISYFYRRSQTYDTLMQMGRWFGYRDGYVDLCRIWMTQESVEWYTYINRATEKLKDQFYIMYRKGKTPMDFGLIVENDLTTLQITGRAKLHSAPDTVEIPISNSGKMIDTVHFYVDPENVSINHSIINDVVDDIEAEGVVLWKNSLTGNYVLRNVPKKYVQRIINGYSNPPQNDAFKKNVILEQISNDEISCLDYWDVAIVSRLTPAGASEPFIFKDKPVNMVARTALHFESDGDEDDYGKVAKMTKGMFITATDVAEGLYNDEGEFDTSLKEKLAKQYLEEAARNDDSNKKKHAPAVAYLALDHTKKRPLLLIYFVDLAKRGESLKPEFREKIAALNGMPPVALAIGYPSSNELGDSKGKKTLRYRPNQIYARFGNEDLDEADI